MAETPQQIPHRRQLRNIIIHKPLQKQYTLLMIGLMMATVLSVVSVIQYTMKSAVFGNPYRVGSVNPYELLSDMTQQLVMRVSLVFLLATVVFTVLGVFFLHRVAGPVHRFRMILNRLASGEIPSDIRLRQNDYFSEVATEFNGVFKSLRQKKMLAKEISGSLDKITPDSLDEEGKRAIQDARQKLKEI